ncbi:LANO_0H19944g1_1 [Lachancea nothofagi CBS 11611]|uniref:LANO_0H19944g1_1 n=1 Tax=Lachancea nothofagi CBS 11611 TaxID=1266666 RepID=A0A1G4KNF2_9SACH|nr:LANO_0H19944g1_1 [Lachancea nothofagi CBS 11611]
MALQDIKEEETDLASDAHVEAVAASPVDTLPGSPGPPLGAQLAPMDIVFDDGAGRDDDGDDLSSIAPPHPFASSQEALLPPLPQDHTVLMSPVASDPQEPAGILQETAMDGDTGSLAAGMTSSRSTSAASVTTPTSHGLAVARRALSGSPLASLRHSPSSTHETTASVTEPPKHAAHKLSSTSFDISSALEIPHNSEPDSSFDLSKALEIPNDSAATAVNTNANTPTTSNVTSLATAALAPHITSPKLSLKKKFSSTLLPTASASTPTVSNPTVDISSRIGSAPDFSIQHIQRHSSVRSRTTTPDIPRLSSNIDLRQGLGIEHSNLDSSTSAVNTNRVLLRKFSVGSSSSSSRSFHENDENVAFKPPPNFTLDTNSSSSLHDLKSPRSSLNYAEAANIQNKKIPLLKRASSAILRKASMTKKAPSSPSTTNPSNYYDLRHTASFSTIPYDTKDSDLRGTSTDQDKVRSMSARNTKKLSLRTKSNYVSPRCISNPEGLHHVSSLPTPPIGSSFCATPETQSFGSKFKNGLTRIIGVNGSDRSFKSANGNQNSILTTQGKPSDGDHAADSILADIPSPAQLNNLNGLNSLDDQKDDQKDEFFPPRSALSTRESSNSAIPQQNTSDNDQLNKRGQLTKRSTAPSMGSVNTAKVDSVFSGDSDESLGEGSESDELTVDIDELTKALPTITITEKLGARNVTPIQTQSNLLLDLIYKESSGYRFFSSQRKGGDEKPGKISLKEYIDVLIKQQRIEDERLAVLEHKFANNGWCSQDDLYNIQQKRIIINKKWAERISYYQGRLDA